MTGYLNKFYLQGVKTRLRIKLQMIEKQHSFTLVSIKGSSSFYGSTVTSFLSVLRQTMKWPFLGLTLSYYQTELVWSLYSIELFMFDRRITGFSCECQASFLRRSCFFFPPFSEVTHSILPLLFSVSLLNQLSHHMLSKPMPGILYPVKV